MKSLLATRLDQTNRNLMMMGLGLALGAAALLWWGPRDLQRVYLEPDRMTVDMLAKALNTRSLSRTYLGVLGERVIDTGYVKVEQGIVSGREQEAGSYVALTSDENLLLVKTNVNASRPFFRGVLVPLSDPVKEEVLRSLERDYPHLKGHFLPYMLDASGIPVGSLSLFAAALGTLFLGAFFLHRGARGLEDPGQYSPLKELVRRDELDRTLEQIDFEWRTDPDRMHIGKTVLCHNWLITSDTWRVEVAAMENIAWIYRERGNRRWLPFAKERLVVRTSDGRKITIKGHPSPIGRIHDGLVYRAPWAVVGHNRSLEMLWTVDRRAFLSEVNERRDNAMEIA